MNARSCAAPTGSLRRLLCLFGFVALLAMTGCGDKLGKLHRVEGKVTIPTGPLTAGTVTYYPDPPKPGATPLTPSGTVEGDGSYKLMTQGKPGAPAGKYKVTVTMPAAGGTTATGSDLAATTTVGKERPKLFNQAYES